MPDTQVLVIGSGVAGLTYALKVAGFADVLSALEAKAKQLARR